MTAFGWAVQPDKLSVWRKGTIVLGYDPDM
jgi:hypothetical protein